MEKLNGGIVICKGIEKKSESKYENVEIAKVFLLVFRNLAEIMKFVSLCVYMCICVYKQMETMHP